MRRSKIKLEKRDKTKLFVATFLFCLFISFSAGAYALKINFFSQAPEKQWSQPWYDACEEASIAIVDEFYNNHGHKLTDEEASKKILRIFEIKEAVFGQSYDEKAEKIVDLINNFLNWEAKLKYNPTKDQIIEEIDNGRPVIVPVYARILNNKYFNSAAIDYHVFVLSGYDQKTKEFITQEVGTQYGNNYRYPYSTIMSAIHNFVPGNTKNGDKVVIFTSPVVINSAQTDGDKDGLVKSMEIRYQTDLFNIDSDSDGETDVDEFRNGYSPITDESRLRNGDLIKSIDSSKVYVLRSGKKHHILSLEAFNRWKFKWENLHIVGNRFLEELPDGYNFE